MGVKSFISFLSLTFKFPKQNGIEAFKITLSLRGGLKDRRGTVGNALGAIPPYDGDRHTSVCTGSR